MRRDVGDGATLTTGLFGGVSPKKWGGGGKETKECATDYFARPLLPFGGLSRGKVNGSDSFLLITTAKDAALLRVNTCFLTNFTVPL